MSVTNKRNKLPGIVIAVVALLLSISLGMMDHETTSLMQLLAGDSGANLIALLLYALIFAGIIYGMTKIVRIVEEE